MFCILYTTYVHVLHVFASSYINDIHCNVSILTFQTRYITCSYIHEHGNVVCVLFKVRFIRYIHVLIIISAFFQLALTLITEVTRRGQNLICCTLDLERLNFAKRNAHRIRLVKVSEGGLGVVISQVPLNRYQQRRVLTAFTTLKTTVVRIEI